MSGIRQVFLGFFMALLFSAIVLGSLSLSLVETGYMLGQAPEPASPDVDLSGAVFLSLVGEEAESNAPVSRNELNQPEVVLQKPTEEPCVHPEGWIQVTVRPDYNLRSLAHLTNSSVQLLKEGNCLLTEGLTVNSVLYVPMLPLPPTAVRPRPTYPPPVYYPTPYPTVWPTPIPWVPTMTPVTPPPTQPPTLPPSPPPTALPPTPFPTAQPPTPFPTAQPTAPNPPPTNPPPTSPPPTSPPPTSPPPTEPPQPTPVPPTPQPQPTVPPAPQPTAPPAPQPTAPPEPQPTEPRLPPPPQPTAPPPIIPTPPPGQQPPAPTVVSPGSFPTSSPS